MPPDDEPTAAMIQSAEDRRHVLGAISTALADAHKVLDIVLEARDVGPARTALEKAYGFDAIQADAVLSMQFRLAATRYREAVEREVREVDVELARLRQEPGAKNPHEE
ncbi:MAG: hypothetical protein NTX33_01500 [Propionibacteriales bacterium]|nr:hypothetical protein [Propionibacteriales bacterium]